MDTSDQLRNPAALPQGKHAQVLNVLEAGWAPEPVWTEINLLPQEGLEPRLLRRPALSIFAIPTELCDM
jgi:hypothetical protein